MSPSQKFSKKNLVPSEGLGCISMLIQVVKTEILLKLMTPRSSFCIFLALLVAASLAPAQSASPVTAATLQQLLGQDRFLEFENQLGQARNLTTEQRLYFLGMLAFHVGRFEDAIMPLVKAANSTSASLTPEQVEEALETLGQNALKQSQYGSSAEMYDIIDKTWGAKMADGGKSIREKRHFAALLRQVPAQTIQISGGFTLPRTGQEYPVNVGGKPFFAQFDTGAEISVLSTTTAKNWGVTMLEGTATLHGYGGGAFSAQPGFIPVLTIGKAELRNVAVYVTADQNLYITEINHQFNALLGFPVVSALGRLTFARDGSLTVAAQSPAADPRTDIHLWFAAHALLLPLGTVPVMDGKKLISIGEPRLFMLDTGSGSSFLTDHYFAEHANAFHGPPPETARLAGAGGIEEISAYGAQGVPLFIGNNLIMLNGPHVLTKPTSGEVEHYFGLIGQDLLQNFSSYTLDFRTNAFSAQP
jgi:Aspartyl protease